MVRFHLKRFLYILLLPAGVLDACVEHHFPAPAVECSAVDEISYSTEVEPIITAHCSISGCHNGTLGSEKDWTNPLTLQSKSAEVKRRVLLPDSDNEKMPLTGSLNQEQITLLVCWVEQGAQIDN